MLDSTATLPAPPLVFGIFPGITGAEDARWNPSLRSYDPGRNDHALAELQPFGRPFMLRSYIVFQGRGRPRQETPPDIGSYLYGGRQLDYALCYRSPDGDIEGWLQFVREMVRVYGPQLATLQIGEEPNNPDAATGGNGSFPRILDALVQGVFAAQDEARREGLNIPLGMNAVPSFDPHNTFWQELVALGGSSFIDALAYIGFDFFPDVFRPLPFASFTEAVTAALTHFRTLNLTAAGIPTTLPIHITENGWCTGTNRPPEKQAEVLETIVRTIHSLRGTLNLTHYEYYCLRDPANPDPDSLTQFGLVTADYTPKPAFETYRRLIAELGAGGHQ